MRHLPTRTISINSAAQYGRSNRSARSRLVLVSEMYMGILAIYSRDRGQRSAAIGFNVGQGTQDIGFRNEMSLLFTAAPAQALRLGVHDENGAPTIAAFTIRDGLGRLYPNPAKRLAPDLFNANLRIDIECTTRAPRASDVNHNS